MNNVVVRISGNAGYIFNFGLKLDTIFDANQSLGLYRGSSLSDNNASYDDSRSLTLTPF